MKSYKKLTNLRDETKFLIKRTDYMLKIYLEEAEEIKFAKNYGEVIREKKAALLDQLLKDLKELYEIK